MTTATVPEYAMTVEPVSHAPIRRPEPPSLVDSDVDCLTLAWSPPRDNGAAVTEYKLEMNDPQNSYGMCGNGGCRS